MKPNKSVLHLAFLDGLAHYFWKLNLHTLKGVLHFSQLLKLRQMRIGLISDTHSYLDPQVLDYFAPCDEIWHAGDIGAPEVADQLAVLKPLRAVYGNIDGPPIRHRFPENLVFECAGLHVWITHIGGYPPNYTPAVRRQLAQLRPQLFICGHSHILKALPDAERGLLHLNPGAAGHEGFHRVRTLMRFAIEQQQGRAAVRHLEAIELGKRGAKL